MSRNPDWDAARERVQDPDQRILPRWWSSAFHSKTGLDNYFHVCVGQYHSDLTIPITHGGESSKELGSRSADDTDSVQSSFSVKEPSPAPPSPLPVLPMSELHLTFQVQETPALSPNTHPAPYDNPLATVIQAFPWNNGIMLLQGSMADTLQSLSPTKVFADTEMQNSLLLVRDPFHTRPGALTYLFQQTQAQVLDAFSLSQGFKHDPRIQAFLQRLAAVDRDSFFKNGGWSDVSLQALAVIAHVLVHLHIFDHFVDALAFPPQATVPILRTIPFPYEFPDRVRRVRIFRFLLFLTC